MSTDPSRQRPRSSKKRRAVQSGGAAGRPQRPARAGGGIEVRGGSAAGGIPTLWLGAIGVLLFAVGVALAGGVIKFGGGGAAPSSAIAGRASIAPGSSPAASAVARYGTNCLTAAPAAAPAGLKKVVSIETAKGTIEVTVEADLGPLAAANFLALSSCGYYDGLIFHRIVPGFVIQGGDPTGTGSGGPGYEFADDPVTVPYARGVVAMANSGPDTNGSQFFIVLKDATGLGPNYSVFGRVTAGMDAVDAIAAAADAEHPSQPIKMDKVTVKP